MSEVNNEIYNPAGLESQDEFPNFIMCQKCGHLFDRRDLDEVRWHEDEREESFARFWRRLWRSRA